MTVDRGGLYWVNDAQLSLPPNDQRQVHPQRMVLVLSSIEQNANPTWPLVAVMPLSSASQLKTQFCVKLAAAEANVSKKCWIRVPAIQPIEKSLLGDFVGRLDAERLEDVEAQLARYLGLI